MSLAIRLNTVPFPSESTPSPLVLQPGPLHRRRGVDLGMTLQMPAPAQFGYGYAVGNETHAVAATAAAAAVFNTTERGINNNTSSTTIAGNNLYNPGTGRLGYASSSSGIFGSAVSANASTTLFWSPASAAVGTKGPLQPHVSNLPRRKPTVRRRD
ncbi:hypothetical protein C8R41DRAFT_980211 [Lentinula lateritia]|uniref:Uncharacterized protein n=1 Tax=Lentinula lateritia TaxID=40482 RepID=A0ABQ8VK32_9AGAR|nr:hypothetical protein C8R41DRAFT_980211 [Lentinula lateritia]